MKQEKVVKGIGALIALVLLALIISGIAGCGAAKIKAGAIEDYKASSKFPKDCATEFPLIPDTIFTEGKVITDTVIDYRYFDSTIQVVNGTDTVYATITIKEPVRTITVTKTDTISKVVVDKRLVISLGRELQEADNACSANVDRMNAKAEKDAAKIKKTTKQRNAGFLIATLAGIYIFRWQLISLFGGLFGKIGTLLKKIR